MGRPADALVNDSNLDWNQSLPEARRFAEEHGLQKIELDDYGLNDPSSFIPQARVWDCQKPAVADSGQWVIVSAGEILDGHNCGWLLQYPQDKLAGGSLYAFQLPGAIPATGTAGGPPLPAAYRTFGGAPFDMRGFFLGIIHSPETLPQAYAEMTARYAGPGSTPTVATPAPGAK